MNKKASKENWTIAQGRFLRGHFSLKKKKKPQDFTGSPP